MYKLCLTLFLVAPAVLGAQGFTDTSATVSSNSAGVVDSASSQDSSATAPADTTGRRGGRRFGRFMEKPDKQAPVGSLGLTYTYVRAEDIAGHPRTLMGWTATPEVNFTRHLGLQADFTSLYVRSIYPGQTRLLFAAGPRFNFAPSSKINPFIFLEGGEVRLSTKANAIKSWNPVAKGGIGFDYKLSHGFGLQLIPAEYIGQYMDTDSWTHNVSARGGIVFNFYK